MPTLHRLKQLYTETSCLTDLVNARNLGQTDFSMSKPKSCFLLESFGLLADFFLQTETFSEFTMKSVSVTSNTYS